MLYLVATPLSDKEEITLKAIETFKKSSLLIAESNKIGSYYLKKYAPQAELLLLNEHSNANEIAYLAKVCQKEIVCLISDGGTPNFCDPGLDLIRLLIKNSEKIENIYPIAGASSLMSALSICPFKTDRFLFLGFTNRNPEVRIAEFKQALKIKIPVVIFDTAYRLSNVISDLILAQAGNFKALLALNLSADDQEIYYSKINSLSKNLDKKLKKNFVLIVNPASF